MSTMTLAMLTSHRGVGNNNRSHSCRLSQKTSGETLNNPSETVFLVTVVLLNAMTDIYCIHLWHLFTLHHNAITSSVGIYAI